MSETQREIKFRVWDKKKKEMHYQEECHIGRGFGTLLFSFSKRLTDYGIDSIDNYEIEQYIGIKDKDGKEIFEGDRVRIKYPGRDEQSHEGPNIPTPDNLYTEPLEPVINKKEFLVSYKNGCFGGNIELPDGNFEFMPWEYFMACYSVFDIEEMRELFKGGWNILTSWEDPEEGDLVYLLEVYKVGNEEELFNLLGIEIIGNIHDQKEDSKHQSHCKADEGFVCSCVKTPVRTEKFI